MTPWHSITPLDWSRGWSILAMRNPSPAIPHRPCIGKMSVEEQRDAGATPDMIRVSVGFEHIDDDIIADLSRALAAIGIRTMARRQG